MSWPAGFVSLETTVPPSMDGVAQWTSQTVAAWLRREFPVAPETVEEFLEEEIDGAMLLQLDDETLDELGVFEPAVRAAIVAALDRFHHGPSPSPSDAEEQRLAEEAAAEAARIEAKREAAEAKAAEEAAEAARLKVEQERAEAEATAAEVCRPESPTAPAHL